MGEGDAGVGNGNGLMGPSQKPHGLPAPSGGVTLATAAGGPAATKGLPSMSVTTNTTAKGLPSVTITTSATGSTTAPTISTSTNSSPFIPGAAPVGAPAAPPALPKSTVPGTPPSKQVVVNNGEIRSVLSPEYSQTLASDSATSSPLIIAPPYKPAQAAHGAITGPAVAGKTIATITPAGTARIAVAVKPPATLPSAGASASALATPMSALPPSGPSAATSPAPVAAQKVQPPPHKEVLREAFLELQEGGTGTISSVKELIHALRTKQIINITIDQAVQVLFFVLLGLQLLLVKLLPTSPWHLFVFSIVGVGLGLAFSYFYYMNKKKKAESCDVLGMNVGLKGLQHLVGTLPSWLSYTDREKIQWLNSVLEEVWPYYDKGVCKMVKKMTDEIFASTLKTMKVPGIKRIYFQQLTFGDAPFKVESVHVSDKHKDALVMEVDVRWVGDANITLAVELSVPGQFAKMCPKVSDISFVGSLRIMLRPLVDTIPGFGAAVVTFRKRPRYKYNLNFGRALGGGSIASVVKPVINYVIDTQIISSYIWPQRLVVPIINTEAMQIEVDKLQYRHKGIIKVVVQQAADLINTDTVGKSDPMVELTCDNKHTVSTKTHRNTLTPKWDETFYLLVQEPTSQEMLVAVYDKDLFSAKELLTLHVGDAFGAKELMGRASIKLAPITSQPGEPLTKWYPLGLGDFSNAEGCGKGQGRIQLTCLYRSLESFSQDEVATANVGSVVVQVFEVRNMPRAPNKRSAPMAVYVRAKCGSEAEQTGTVSSRGPQHRWTTRNVLEFHNAAFKHDISLKVFEDSMIGDDLLCELELPIATISEAHDRNPLTGKYEPGLMLRQFKLSGEGPQGAEERDDTKAALYASVRWVPYF